MVIDCRILVVTRRLGSEATFVDRSRDFLVVGRFGAGAKVVAQGHESLVTGDEVEDPDRPGN